MLPSVFMVVWLATWLVSAPAYAEPVLFLHSEPRAAELYEALELELRGFGNVVALRPTPEGSTQAARTASALAAARQVAAVASVWVERDPPLRVRVVHARNEQIVEAPLPEFAVLEARTFGAVAGSVVLEALAQRSTQAQDAPTAAQPGEQPAPATRPPPWQAPSAAAFPPAQPSQPRRVRPFVRLGGVLGVVLARHYHTPDRTPASIIDEVDAAARVAGALDTATAAAELRERGFDCDARDWDGALAVTNCRVELNPPGAVPVSAVELQAGIQWSSNEFAMTTRFAPNAGQGTLAHWLLGAQVGRLLTAPSEQGFWAEPVLGFGVGQVQARPAPESGAAGGPFIRSGLLEGHVGGLLGYRFLPELGLYGGVVARGFMPDPLFVFDLSAGLEARL